MAQTRRRKTKYHYRMPDLSVGYQAALNSFKKFLKELYTNGSITSEKKQILNINIIDAIGTGFESIEDIEDRFQSNEECKEFLEDLLWENKIPSSPYAPSSKVYKCRDGWYKCKNTGKEFNILTGTLFQGTKIELKIWFKLIYRMYSTKGGVASVLVADNYEITQASAWYMQQKIGYLMGLIENFHKVGGEGKIVETDEYYDGGSYKNMHYDKKLKAKKELYGNKKPLQCCVERNGNAVIRAISDTTEGTINGGILKYTKQGSTLYTDDNPSYKKLPPLYKRGSVVHSKGNYVDKDNPNIHTNNAESLWSTHKKTVEPHVHISKKHEQNYANRTVFRFNARKMTSEDATIWFLQNIQGSKITRKEIIEGRHNLRQAA